MQPRVLQVEGLLLELQVQELLFELENLVLEGLFRALLFSQLLLEILNAVRFVKVCIFSLLGEVARPSLEGLKLVAEGGGLLLPPALLVL